MKLVELFIPMERGDGTPAPPEDIEAIVAGMVDRFGGATAFLRSPANGLWQSGGQVTEDRIVIIEVMVDEIDEAWWTTYRQKLEAEFRQESILIRVTECRTL